MLKVSAELAYITDYNGELVMVFSEEYISDWAFTTAVLVRATRIGAHLRERVQISLFSPEDGFVEVQTISNTT